RGDRGRSPRARRGGSRRHRFEQRGQPPAAGAPREWSSRPRCRPGSCAKGSASAGPLRLRDYTPEGDETSTSGLFDEGGKPLLDDGRLAGHARGALRLLQQLLIDVEVVLMQIMVA